MKKLELKTTKLPKVYQKSARAAINKIIEHVRIIGCSVQRGYSVQGLNQIDFLVPHKINQHVRHDINEFLNYKPRIWQIWLGVFTEHTNGDKEVEISLVEKPEMTSVDLGEVVDGMVIEAGNNPERIAEIVGFGWVATPSLQYDLNQEDETLVEFFEKMGVYNREKRDRLIEEVMASEDAGDELWEMANNVKWMPKLKSQKEIKAEKESIDGNS